MPVYTPYPGPGRGISPAGINKNSGFKADIVSQSGINKQAGKSISGLDTAANPIVTSYGLTAVTGTTTTLTWTTQIGAPLGTVTWRKADGTGVATTTNETGSPPVTSHSIPLTGLTAATYYTYTVTQPGAAGTGGKTVFSGRFGTTGTVTPTEGQSSQLDGAPGPGFTDTTGVTDSQDLLTPAPTPEETGEAPGLAISGLVAAPESATSIVVTWRTDAYAEGVVHIREAGPGGDPLEDEPEAGNKRMNHTVTVEGLEAATTYVVSVESTDAAGDSATSEEVEVTTLP